MATSRQVVSMDGRVMRSGSGEVPADVATQYSFQLRASPTSHWFIMLPTGKVIKSGIGNIPDDIRNLYAGFAPGMLNKPQILKLATVWKNPRFTENLKFY